MDIKLKSLQALAFFIYIYVKNSSIDNVKSASKEELKSLILKDNQTNSQSGIIQKILNNQRISDDEALSLFNESETGLLGLLADYKNQSINGRNVYFNKNIHIEPTNVCVYNCKFCSYSRRPGDKKSWTYNLDDIREFIKKYKHSGITEVHMVGGVHPEWKLPDYKNMIEVIKDEMPNVYVKAYTAVEITYISKKSGLSIKEVLQELKKSGLDAMPGGGAEILIDNIRKEICPDKCSDIEWLEVHRQAHLINIPTNATILYGHIETIEDRIEHMVKLRTLQDETNGFNAFIPLKYRVKNNILPIENETTVIEDLKNYALSRIFLDNFRNIKAYWPMIGRQSACLSLSFGVNDLDGTIDDSTKIYTMAGSEEQKPAMTTDEMIRIIKESKKIPVERDTVYHEIETFEN